jgi:cobalt-zinc-cadmium efflux system protein
METHAHAAGDGHRSGFAHQANTAVFRRALFLTSAYALIEVVGGLWAHSLALLGDAGHVLVDALALTLALFAGRLANRPASARHSFGLGRVEVLMADLNGLLMLALVVALVTAALLRLEHPDAVRVAGPAVAAIGFGGLLVNAGVFLVLRGGAPTLNQRGALLHVLGDLLGSGAATVSGLVIALTGWMPIDALASLFIAVLILVAALRLIRSTLPVLLEGVPAGFNLAEIGRTMAAVDGVVSVHDLHVWGVASDQVALAAHVVVRDLGRWDEILADLASGLAGRYGIRHVTLQPEPFSYRLEPLAYAERTPPPAPTPGAGSRG